MKKYRNEVISVFLSWLCHNVSSIVHIVIKLNIDGHEAFKLLFPFYNRNRTKLWDKNHFRSINATETSLNHLSTFNNSIVIKHVLF